MGCLLRPGKPVALEIVRIATRQPALALARLRIAADSERNSAVHATRRHIKTIGALMTQVRRALGHHQYAADIHRSLVRRDTMAREQAAVNDLAGTAARPLRRERDRVRRWSLSERGFRAVAEGHARTVTAARRAKPARRRGTSWPSGA